MPSFPGDRRGSQLGAQLPDLRRVDADRVALVFAGAFALPLEHDLAFPRRHAGQDRQHELAGRVAGVQPFAAHERDHEAVAALRQIRLVPEGAATRAGAQSDPLWRRLRVHRRACHGAKSPTVLTPA